MSATGDDNGSAADLGDNFDSTDVDSESEAALHKIETIHDSDSKSDSDLFSFFLYIL